MLKFEKVDSTIYIEDAARAFFNKIVDELTADELNGILDIYNDIELPQRGTVWSAGYDFFAPTDIRLEAGKWITIPTGIRFVTDDSNVVMLAMPRSGLGFKYINRLANTVGVIDADYQFAANTGHIMAKMTADVNTTIVKHTGYLQGIFIHYLTTDDDRNTRKRIGGFGSTSI